MDLSFKNFSISLKHLIFLPYLKNWLFINFYHFIIYENNIIIILTVKKKKFIVFFEIIQLTLNIKSV
jgi:hypothetical protein